MADFLPLSSGLRSLVAPCHRSHPRPVAKARDAAYGLLEAWLLDETRQFRFSKVREGATHAADDFIGTWIQFAFDHGRTPLSVAKNAVLGATDRHVVLRGRLSGSWDRLRSWEHGEPFELRAPWPTSLFHAALGFALACNWFGDFFLRLEQANSTSG